MKRKWGKIMSKTVELIKEAATYLLEGDLRKENGWTDENIKLLEQVKNENFEVNFSTIEGYDMDALYLYNDGWQYRIGRIQKVNEKSLRMQYGTKVLKEDFKDVHKLTEEERSSLNTELVKKLSKSISNIKDVISLVKSLKSSLLGSELVCVDITKLQDKLDMLNDILADEIKPIILNNEKYDFNDFSERLIKVNEEGEK